MDSSLKWNFFISDLKLSLAPRNFWFSSRILMLKVSSSKYFLNIFVKFCSVRSESFFIGSIFPFEFIFFSALCLILLNEWTTLHRLHSLISPVTVRLLESQVLTEYWALSLLLWEYILYMIFHIYVHTYFILNFNRLNFYIRSELQIKNIII